MEALRRIVSSRAIQHIAFWGLSFYLSLQLFRGPGGINRIDLIYTSVFHISLAACVYTNNIILIPRLLDKRKYVLYGLAFLATLIIASELHFLIFDVLVGKIFPDYYFISDFGYYEILKFHLGYMGLATLLKLSKDRFRIMEIRQKMMKLKEEKLASEIKALKSQVNPHFLFNSLNNIYSLALDNSPETSKMILNLSDFYRYILYDTGQDRIELGKEIMFLKKYIEVQKLRFENHEKIKFKVGGNTDDLWVSPLIFFPLIENAFKHGTVENKESDSIEISISVTQNSVGISVLNTIPHLKEMDVKESSGIGLDNVRRRLELEYPEKHSLTILDNGKIFQVDLIIDCEDLCRH